MRGLLRAFFFVFLICPTVASAAQPWDAPFAADTASIRLEASQVPSGDDDPIVMLLEDRHFLIDKQGRTNTTIRQVYRIRKKWAVSGWGSVEWEYQPWYEDRPAIKARVLTAEGAAHWLDPKTITDSPSRQFDASIFSDRRVVRAPLPAVAEGAVVEVEITVEERAPLLQSGVVRRVSVGGGFTVRRFHVLIDAHKAIPLRTAAGLIPPSAIQREVTRNGIRVEVDFRPLEPRKDFESDLPPDVPQQPYFSFSTGQSWQAVAAEYEGIVESALASANLTAFLADIDLKGDQREVVSRLNAKLHREVRYTGVELAEAEIVPGPPAQTLQRKYGDCKDKSVLLVAMLRAAGIPARLALLSAGFDTDIDAELPGMGLFNHAIVYAETDPPLWIDATAERTPVGTLPVMDQDRKALIVRSDATELVPTPASTAEENRMASTLEIRLSEHGKGQIEETIEAQGSFAETFQDMIDLDDEGMQKRFEGLVEAFFRGGKLESFDPPSRESAGGPLRFRISISNAPTAITLADEAHAAIPAGALLQSLPFPLSSALARTSFGADDKDDESPKRRQHDLVFRQPHTISYRYTIHPPALFQPDTLPEALEIQAGPATFARSFQKLDGGVVEATYMFQSGKRRWTPDDVLAFHDAIAKKTPPLVDLVRFLPVTHEMVAANQLRKAIKLMQAHLAEHSGSAATRARYSRLLLQAGLGGPARQQADQAVADAPESTAALRAQGWGYQHDLLGRRFFWGWEPEIAKASYRKAIEADAEDRVLKAEVAEVFSHNSRGVELGSGAELEEAIALWREMMIDTPARVPHPELVRALIRTGRFDEARSELAKTDPQLRSRTGLMIVAAEEGAEAMLRRAQAAAGDQVSFLSSLAYDLLRLRRYEAAADLMSAAARSSAEPRMQAFANMWSRVRRHEEALAPQSSPLRPVQQFLLALYGVGAAVDETPDSASLAEARRFREEASRSLGPAGSTSLNDENRADILMTGFEASRDGDDQKGYAYSIYYLPPIYVAPEGEGFKRIGSAENLAPVGEHVLALLDRGEIEVAKWWIKKVAAAAHAGPDEPGLPAVNSLVSWVTDATTDPESIRPAAASLIGRYGASEPAIAILTKARDGERFALDQAQLDLALCEAYSSAGRWDAVMATAKDLLKSRHFKEEGLYYAQKAAQAAGRWQELEALASARLQEEPENRVAFRAMAIAKSRQGDPAGAREWLDKLGQGPFAGLAVARLEAWLGILAGKPDAKLIPKLTPDERGSEDPHTQLSLAALHAALDQPEDAMHAFRLATVNASIPELDSKAWIVYGKICELYGFAEEAAKAYDRGRSTPTRDEMDWWALALL